MADQDFIGIDGHQRDMHLDCIEITALDVEWVHSDGGAMIGDIKINQDTRFDVLHYCIKIFKTKKTWVRYFVA